MLQKQLLYSPNRNNIISHSPLVNHRLVHSFTMSISAIRVVRQIIIEIQIWRSSGWPTHYSHSRIKFFFSTFRWILRQFLRSGFLQVIRLINLPQQGPCIISVQCSLDNHSQENWYSLYMHIRLKYNFSSHLTLEAFVAPSLWKLWPPMKQRGDTCGWIRLLGWIYLGDNINVKLKLSS